jgi:formylglycine-generating enzyme required for sulfatase activity
MDRMSSSRDAPVGLGLRQALSVACAVVCVITCLFGTGATAAPAVEAGIDWQPLDGLAIARTETTVGQFRRHVQATGVQTEAERRGGGEVYEAGWTRKPGWTWRTPFGRPAADDEPAVHLTWYEAQAFCRWAGGRLPTDDEWARAAYTEQRPAPPPPWRRGQTYRYPTGDSPQGAICLGDCGPQAEALAVPRGQGLQRGAGHAPVGRSPAGVNGLHDMGGNAWEWVDDPPDAAGEAPRRTRGGSWWYGEGPMRAEHRQDKPAGTAVVYIGFRCARPATAR